jgi:hypothetical protein
MKRSGQEINAIREAVFSGERHPRSAVLSFEAVSTRPTVRAKDRAINPVGVAFESGHHFAALSLPEPGPVGELSQLLQKDAVWRVVLTAVAGAG